jgi:CRISPR-associated protein Cas1
MLNRIIEICDENRYLSLSRGFVTVQSGNAVLGQVPLDDISVLLLSAQGITLTKNILNAIAEKGGITVICGKNYIPQAMVMPFATHSLFTKISKNQINCSQPFKKRIWQQLVIKKIQNQAKVLELCNKNSTLVYKISTMVKSGDPDNREAYAAKMYWKELFGDNFKRDRDADGINSFLNYGYAIMRGSMARAICSAGLLPSLGINHNNNLNQFCLADDLFEIYRPIIDIIVYKMNKEGEFELNPQSKKKLTETLWVKVHTSEGYSPVFQSMQYMVASYVHAMEDKNPVIELPEWDANEDEKY